MNIHHAYLAPVEGKVAPGTIEVSAARLLQDIPYGHSVVYLQSREYAYDPEWLIKGTRYFKVDIGSGPSWQEHTRIEG